MEIMVFHYIVGIDMYNAYISYLNGNMEVCKKDIGEIKDSDDIFLKVVHDIYILEYMYMPMALLVIEEDGEIFLKYTIEKIDEKLFLVSR